MKRHEFITGILGLICIFAFSSVPALLLLYNEGDLFSLITTFVILFGISFFISGMQNKNNKDIFIKDTIIGFISVAIASTVLLIDDYESMGIVSYIVILFIFIFKSNSYK